MKLFDSHAHYNDEKFLEDRENILREIKEAGVEKLIVAGYNLEKSKEAIKIANEHENIYATVGISPNDLDTDLDLDEIERIAKYDKVVAIGEIGLDYYWNKENKEKQKEIFKKQIEIANRLDLPIVIHTREAVYDTLEILREYASVKQLEYKVGATTSRPQTGIFHCCPLNVELIKEALKLGYYISFSGNITFKSSKNAEKCINEVPLDRILIETDSPYMSPEPFRGQRNDSRNVELVAKKIAEVKQMDIEEIAGITFHNAEKIFKI